jgi:hypothetical protein
MRYQNFDTTVSAAATAVFLGSQPAFGFRARRFLSVLTV